MINSRVFTLFSKFSPRERRAFKKFVRSPYHNAREDACVLYEYILENHRKAELLDKRKVFDKCFPGHSYDDAKMRQVMTHVCRLMEQYLAVDMLLQNEVQVKLLSAISFKDKKLSAAAKQNLQKAEELLHKSNFRDREYYETSYQIQSEQHLAFAEKGRGKPIDLAPLNKSLELSFIVEKLKRSCYMLTYQNVFKTEHSQGLTEAIVNYVEEQDLLTVPAVKLYYTSYQILLPDAEEHWFYDLKNQLLQNRQLFPKEELRSFVLAAINYAIKKMNKGQVKFFKECFTLYKLGLEYDLFIINGVLSRFTYKNIVSSALKLSEFVWSEQFIMKYKNHLATEYRDSHFSFNLAKLHFSRKNYDKAMTLLVKVEYDDLFLNLDAKTMLVKIYFENDEWDALDSLLVSFKALLYRKKVMGYHKDNYQNIIELTRKISLLGPYHQSDLPEVRQLVQDTNPNTEKEWMLGQLGKMEK